MHKEFGKKEMFKEAFWSIVRSAATEYSISKNKSNVNSENLRRVYKLILTQP